MLNFSEQCMDMARAILTRNLSAINEDGTVSPIDGEISSPDESGHAALALGEFYRATGETSFGGFDLVDLTARCISYQMNSDSNAENGIAYSALGLLSFGPSKDRNPVWDRLLDETRKVMDKQLLTRTDYEDSYQAFNVAKAVARFSMGLSKKDETGKLIDKFIERLHQNSSTHYFDDKPAAPELDGIFDLSGVSTFVFIRQSLQLHANMHLRDRKIPSLRTYAEKYLRLFSDIVRADGLGWSYGRKIGVYGQMHCISLVLQAMRDGWFTEDKLVDAMDMLRRLFQFFFMTYLDQEHGYLVIKDEQRTTDGQSTRLANFDAARYLCQWARLAKSIGKPLQIKPQSTKSFGKYIAFDNSQKKEQGLFVYHNAESGLHVLLPLVSGDKDSSSSLAFPHMPGIFDWPANKYMPVMLPQLTFGEKKITPSFYGKKCTTGLGLRNSFFFRYEQPDLITSDGDIVKDLGSCKVSWTFSGDKIVSDFVFSVKNQVQLDRMSYSLVIAAPHSEYHTPTTYSIGENGLGVAVEKDDFQAQWLDTEIVSDDSDYKTYWGKIHYIQTLERDHPLIMRPGLQYRLSVSFSPDITFYE